jgi:prefoldin beta subunit
LFFSSQELNLLDSEAAVFKLVGPVLLKQDVSEAKDNVKTRIARFKGDM